MRNTLPAARYFSRLTASCFVSPSRRRSSSEAVLGSKCDITTLSAGNASSISASARRAASGSAAGRTSIRAMISSPANGRNTAMARISRSEKSLAIVLFMRSYALSFQLPGACVVSLPEGGRGGAMLVDGSAGGNDGGRKRFVRRSVYSFCLFSDLLQCPLHRTPAQQQFAGLSFVKPRRFGDHPRSAGHELVVGQLHVDHAVALDTPQADHHGCR